MVEQDRTYRSPWVYFGLVLLLTLPFYALGSLFPKTSESLGLPIDLPFSILGFVSPIVAGTILVYRKERWPGLVQYFKRIFDFQRISNTWWYLAIFGLMPLIMLLSYALMHWMNRPLPARLDIPLHTVPLLFVSFFIGAIGEELGWTGYAIDPLQQRYGALVGALILGAFWGMWHFIPFSQTRSDMNWVLWQTLNTIPLRVGMVWLYNRTGRSVFSVIAFHAMVNVSEFLFPNHGSHYDPMIHTLILLVIIAAILIIWEPRYFARRIWH